MSAYTDLKKELHRWQMLYRMDLSSAERTKTKVKDVAKKLREEQQRKLQKKNGGTISRPKKKIRSPINE